MSEQSSSSVGRRQFLGVCSMVGLRQTLLPGALFTLATQAEGQSAAAADGKKPDAVALTKITPEMIDAAAVIAGVTLMDEQKKLMLEGLTSQRDSVVAIRG